MRLSDFLLTTIVDNSITELNLQDRIISNRKIIDSTIEDIKLANRYANLNTTNIFNKANTFKSSVWVDNDNPVQFGSNKKTEIKQGSDGHTYVKNKGAGKSLVFRTVSTGTTERTAIDMNAISGTKHYHNGSLKLTVNDNLVAAVKVLSPEFVEGGTTLSSKYSGINHSHDTRYLGKSAKAVDADKLDGINSSSFARRDTANTFSKETSFSKTIKLANFANIDLGTTSPTLRMYASSTEGVIRGMKSSKTYLQSDRSGSTSTQILLDGSLSRPAVSLYENNQERLKTTSTGVTVNGTVRTNTVTVEDPSNAGSFVDIFTLLAIDGHNHDAAYLGKTANAVSASKLATSRTIALTGDVTGSVSFNGTKNVTITTAVGNDSHTHDGRYYTESESNSRFAYKAGNPAQDFRSKNHTLEVVKFGNDASIRYNASTGSIEFIFT